MSKLWLVARYEYKRHVLRKQFLFGLLSVPLLITVLALVAGVRSLLNRTGEAGISAGYVDQTGLLPPPIALPAGGDADTAVQLLAFSTEDAASAALESGQIQAYFFVGADYPETHRVQAVTSDELGGDVFRRFRAYLRLGLLVDQPAEIAFRAVHGSHMVLRSPDGRLEFADTLTPAQLMPALAGLVFVVLIFFSAGYLAQAVTDEKANRTMEILVTSLSPSQLIGGKLVGIVGVTATQLAAWLAFAVLAVLVGGQVLGVQWLQDINVEPRMIALLVALLVPAYVLVAALMMATGIALGETRGGQQAILLFVALYLIPFSPMLPVIGSPNSALAVGLSLFPVTAPVMMPLRLSLTQVPLWQIAASIAIQGMLALGALWLAARVFRLGMLRYGRRLDWRAVLGTVRRLDAGCGTLDRARCGRHVSRPEPSLGAAFLDTALCSGTFGMGIGE